MRGIVNSQASPQEAINARRARGLGAFAQFSHVWGNRHLSVPTKVKVFNSFIVPHFVYGSETWALTQAQGNRLETAYSSCLRRILGVSITDRHSLQHLWDGCQVPPLRWLLAQRRLSWLGHLARMPEERYPRQALFSRLCGVKNPRGRPAQSFVSTVCGDLQAVGMPSTQGDWYERAQDRPQWRASIRELPKLKGAAVPTRQQPLRSCRLQVRA